MSFYSTNWDGLEHSPDVSEENMDLLHDKVLFESVLNELITESKPIDIPVVKDDGICTIM